MTRWSQFLGSIAAGEGIQESMLKHRMTSSDIEACVRMPEERARWNDARIAARKRAWSVLDIEEIFEKIASGDPVGAAVEAVKGGGRQAIASFVDLCTSDPELNAHYLRALKSRAVLTGEDVLNIVDDGAGKDYLDNGKGGLIPDNAAVNRAKLRADARLRLMGNWFPKLFGEKQAAQVNVQIVNHAERLEQARQRRDTRSVAPRISHDVVEAAFREVGKNDTTSQQVDTSGWDDVPVSTVWRETE
jgi:hypothetical protein